MAKRLFFLLLAALPLVPYMLAYDWGNDYFFLAETARAFVQGVSPYTDEVSWAVYGNTQCGERCAESGFAYPLPALLLVLPFAWLPHNVGALIFIACSVALIVWCLDRLNVPPVALLFAPLAWAAFYGNPTIMLVGLILLGIVLVQRQSWRMLGLVTVLLLAVKPHTVLVFALYFLWRLWRVGRLHYALVPGITLLLASLVVQPTWPTEWVTQLSTYRESQPTYAPWFLIPLGLYLFSRGQHYPGLALLQIAFPANLSIYVFSPLLAATVGHPRLVWPLLVGSACWYVARYLNPIYYLPSSFLIPITIMFLLYILLMKHKRFQEGPAQQHGEIPLEPMQRNEA
jgi:hypothetical protein